MSRKMRDNLREEIAEPYSGSAILFISPFWCSLVFGAYPYFLF